MVVKYIHHSSYSKHHISQHKNTKDIGELNPAICFHTAGTQGNPILRLNTVIKGKIHHTTEGTEGGSLHL